MKKNNTKWKKYRSIGNEDEEYSTWCTGKDTGMNTING